MEKTFLFLSIFISLLVLNACENKGDSLKKTESKEIEKVFIDDVNAEITAADTSSSGVYQEETLEGEINLKEAVTANSKKTLQEEVISFCDCVKKNKKLTDIMMADETNDADFDKAMKELENMKTGECKIMFPNQNNIEEQQEHLQRVKNCLNS